MALELFDDKNTSLVYKIETPIFKGDSFYGRKAYIKFGDDTVIFDDSDGEYGPIIFSIEELEKALKLHKQKLKEDGS